MHNLKDPSIEQLQALEAENERLRLKLAQLEHTELELRRQKDLWQTIFDHLPIMVNVATPDGKIEAVNRACQRTLGWTSDELVDQTGDSLTRAFFPDPEIRRRAYSTINEGKAEWTDLPLVTKDGHLIETTWMNVHLPDGRWIGAGLELTGQRRAERALEESEDRFRAIYEHGRLGIAVADLLGGLKFVNPSFQRLLGYEESELVGRNFREFTFASDLLVEEVCVQEMIVGNRDHYEIEKRYIRKNGEVIWVAVLAAVLHDHTGKPAYGLAMVRDINERKRGEEMLRRTQAYLAEAERLSHIGTWALYHVNRQLIFWSEEHFHIFGFDPSDGIPSMDRIVARVHSGDADALAIFESALSEGRDYETEYRIVLPDGSVRNILSIGHPIRNEAGEIVEFSGVAMDVTERKKFERQLQESFSQLRALATQFNRIREDEGRRIARELHDELGSSLTSLKWDLEAVEQSFSPPEAVVDRNSLRARLRRMTELANSTIRTVKRISSELRPVILDDLGLCEAVEWETQNFQERTGIQCHFEFTGENSRFSREQATAIFRIIQEALTNILRHAQATCVRIKIEESGCEILLRIADDGRGISPEQATGPRSLGLLGMRERAHLVGGSVEITGQPGQGTEVNVRLPRSDVALG